MAHPGSAVDHQRAAKVRGGARRVQVLDDRILARRQATDALRATRAVARRDALVSSKHAKEGKLFALQKVPDDKLRPPDRAFPTRVQGLQDRVLWSGAEGESLRGWYVERGEDASAATTPAPPRRPLPSLLCYCCYYWPP